MVSRPGLPSPRFLRTPDNPSVCISARPPGSCRDHASPEFGLPSREPPHRRASRILFRLHAGPPPARPSRQVRSNRPRLPSRDHGCTPHPCPAVRSSQWPARRTSRASSSLVQREPGGGDDIVPAVSVRLRRVGAQPLVDETRLPLRSHLWLVEFGRSLGALRVGCCCRGRRWSPSRRVPTVRRLAGSPVVIGPVACDAR